MRAWNGLTAAGPVEMGMSFLRGDETAQEIIILAYGMEEGLRGFYTAISEGADDSDVADLGAGLSKIEERHKERLFNLYLTMDSTIADREAFEADIVRGIMEGGFTTEEFLAQQRNAMKTVPDLLNIAMMLETQALDLYMRYSEKIHDEPGKGVLYDLAEEEKGHLVRLGRLMEAKV